MSPLASGESIMPTPSTIVEFGLTIAGDVASFGPAAQIELMSRIRTATSCYEPHCIVTLRIATASVAVAAILTIPDAQPAGAAANATAVAAAVAAAATALVAQPAPALSASLGVSVESANDVTVGVAVVPLVVAPPPPPSKPPSTPPPATPLPATPPPATTPSLSSPPGSLPLGASPPSAQSPLHPPPGSLPPAVPEEQVGESGATLFGVAQELVFIGGGAAAAVILLCVCACLVGRKRGGRRATLQTKSSSRGVGTLPVSINVEQHRASASDLVDLTEVVQRSVMKPTPPVLPEASVAKNTRAHAQRTEFI